MVNIDGDNDLDLFWSNGGGSLFFQRNTGSSTAPAFAGASISPFGLTGSGGGLTFVDIDNDGDFDAFKGFGGDILFYENTGTTSVPVFGTPVTNPFGLSNVGTRAVPHFVNIDGDGDLDALIGNGDGNTIFFENTGTNNSPAFALITTNPFGLDDMGTNASPSIVDIDGDGDLDAMILNGTGNTSFFLNAPPPPVGVTITPRNTNVKEGGATDTYDIVLDSAPTDDVTITLIDTVQVTTDTPTITFTTANWNTPQTVTVTAVDDTVGEGVHYSAINATVSSADTNYDSITVDPVRVIIEDNDLPPEDPTFNSQSNNFGLTLTDVGFYASPTFADIDGDGDLDAFIGNSNGETFFFLNQDNLPPTVDNPIVDQNTFEQIAFNFTVPNNTFNDPDVGDTLIYSATLADDTALPAWLGFNANTKTFSGTPTNGDIGTIMVKVTATDTGALSVSDTFDIEIQQLSTLVTNSTGGNDILTGGIGLNLIDGRGGNDSITGNVVADTLRGGSRYPQWLGRRRSSRWW